MLRSLWILTLCDTCFHSFSPYVTSFVFVGNVGTTFHKEGKYVIGTRLVLF